MTRQNYSHHLDRIASAHKFGACVARFSAEELKDHQLFSLLDHQCRFTLAAVSPTGERVAVVSESQDRHQLDRILEMTIAAGATWGNCFDTILPALYRARGSVEVARLTFDDEFAPDDWSFDLYRPWNDGRPDIVFMQIGGTAGPVVRVNTYEEGVALCV